MFSPCTERFTEDMPSPMRRIIKLWAEIVFLYLAYSSRWFIWVLHRGADTDLQQYLVCFQRETRAKTFPLSPQSLQS